MDSVSWASGTWLNPPAESVGVEDGLEATAASGSDFWRTTGYGFIRDSGHALLIDLEIGQAVEVAFLVDGFDAQFDQAGLMIREGEERWIKAGIEMTDGVANLGAVVTNEVSDWSVRPVPNWATSEVTVRASRAHDSVTLRARRNNEPWELIRLCPFGPFDDAAKVTAGPYLCAPSRDGFTVRFLRFDRGDADPGLHPDDQADEVRDTDTHA